MKLMKIIMLFILMLTIADSQAGRHRRIPLPSSLSYQLNSFLDEVVRLHEFLMEAPRDREKINSQMIKVSKQIQSNISLSPSQNAQKMHLQKILPLIVTYLDIAKESEKEKRRQALKDFFRSVVEIVRTYKVNQHRIFFCDKDKSIWLQGAKGRDRWKARNPINQDRYKHCGTRVK